MIPHPSEQAVPTVRKSSFASRTITWLTVLRPLDWIKNLFVFAPLIFSGHLLTLSFTLKTMIGFGLFCILSSASYLLNDLLDRENDLYHPEKASRPVASGQLPISQVRMAMMGITLIGLAGAFSLDTHFGMVALAFTLLQTGYSLGLKDWVIVDALLISSGFVLRVVAGATVVAVVPSAWIILCTVLLSLFLGFAKRRHELIILGEKASAHRKVLQQYSLPFLDQMIATVVSATIVSYALYTINNGPSQIYSVFFVLYGMLRYLYLIHQREQGGHPAKSFFTDRPLVATVVGWILFILWDIYLNG